MAAIAHLNGDGLAWIAAALVLYLVAFVVGDPPAGRIPPRFPLSGDPRPVCRPLPFWSSNGREPPGRLKVLHVDASVTIGAPRERVLDLYATTGVGRACSRPSGASG
jgi:hypothetical protein